MIVLASSFGVLPLVQWPYTIVEDTFELIESERNDKDEVDFQDAMATLRGQVEQHNIVLLEKGLQPLPHKCSVAWAQSVTKAFHKNVRMIRMR